jgi:pimeloyl-ACP methyl ester carboxylesterase
MNGSPFPDIPLTVIAATDHGPFFKVWEPTLMRLQQQLATLSPQATLIVAQGSGHDVQIDRPQTVIDALSEWQLRQRSVHKPPPRTPIPPAAATSMPSR